MKNDLKISRRTFLTAAGGTIVSIGLPGTYLKLSHAQQLALAASIRPDGRPRLPPGQHAVEKILDMGGSPGTATVESWRMRIYGEVERPIVLSYKELLDMEQVSITCDVHCVTGWTLLDSRWTGVRLGTIMDRVKPARNANFIIFEAAEGYTSNIPIRDADQDNVLVAHSFFDERLERAHGAPVRALIPDRYFYKSAKWLEAIKVTSRDEPGFWERSGYSNTADPWKEERYSR